jgi:type I restriction enzyme S subunit
MGSEWRTVQLGELVEIYDGPHATPKKAETGPLFLGISNLASGRLDLSNTEHVSEDVFRTWTRRVAPSPGDLVFSYETRLGEAALIPQGLRACLGRRMGLLRPRGNVDPRFLLYAYLGPAFQQTIRERTVHGSTVNRIPLIEMRSFPIGVPSLAEQRRIARILGDLDDKIELNRKTNETLEAMARALFKSWFVDFDPVRAKAEGRAPSGMDAETAKLFPSELVRSESGPIPTGWKLSSLGREARRCGGVIQTGPFGGQLHASDYVRDGVPVVMPKDIVGRRVSTATIAQVRESDAKRLSRHRLRSGDIVYSRRGDVERHAMISPREDGWLCGTGCLLVRLGPRWPSTTYASLSLDRPESRGWIVQRAVGATMPNLNTGILGEVPILVPSERVIATFDQLTKGLQIESERLHEEASTLARLRDELLPRLLSGFFDLSAVT